MVQPGVLENAGDESPFEVASMDRHNRPATAGMDRGEMRPFLVVSEETGFLESGDELLGPERWQPRHTAAGALTWIRVSTA